MCGIKIIAISFIFLANSESLLSQNWQSVGNGVDNEVRGLFADTIDNTLYVTGAFTLADIVPAYSIASWNGAEWKNLDSGTYCNCCGNPVFDAIRYKNEIYAGGWFYCMGGAPNTQGIARWNGINWSTVGGGLIEGYCKFKIFNDELYVFGAFDTAGSMPFNSIAKWNGNQWSDVYNFPNYNIGNNLNFINDIAMYKDELYIAGNFDHQNGNKEIAKWNGTQWVSVGGGIKGDAIVNKLAVYNDELYVGGYFYRIDGNAGNFLMKWDGNSWIDINWNLIYIGQIWDMKIYNNKLYVVGPFQFAGDTTSFFYNYVSFDGNNWCGLGIKKDPAKLDFAKEVEFFNNGIYIVGRDTMDGDIVHNIAKWIGGNFEDTCVTIVGQNEITDKKSGINIFPNPSDGKFTVENLPVFSGKLNLTIYNSIGQMAYENSITSNQQIDISGLPDGIYLLQGKVQNKIFSQKIILQK